VPTYVTYDPYEPSLQVRCLDNNRYVLQDCDASGQFWIPELQLFLGIWLGERLCQTTHWLRWWDAQRNLLLWSSEQAEQARQQAEAERKRGETEHQRAETLAAKLQELGIDPTTL